MIFIFYFNINEIVYYYYIYILLYCNIYNGNIAKKYLIRIHLIPLLSFSFYKPSL